MKSVIMDPLDDKKIMGTIKAVVSLLGQDEYCLEFIRAFREGILVD